MLLSVARAQCRGGERVSAWMGVPPHAGTQGVQARARTDVIEAHAEEQHQLAARPARIVWLGPISGPYPLGLANMLLLNALSAALVWPTIHP